MGSTFEAILDKYRKISFSQRDKGDRFERLMKNYLLTDRKYADQFKRVYLWNEFPGKNDLGGADTGIDLVAQTFSGDYWAIQCKCYQPGHHIQKADVDTFITTSGRAFKNDELKTTHFAQRLWISTTDNWSKHATESLKNQHPPVARLNCYELANAPVDWEALERGSHGQQARNSGKELRRHQREAVDLTAEYFTNHGRGMLIMACGTGKTFTALRIAERATGGSGLVLFLVPSIALLGQTLNEWTADAKENIYPICICSDPAITKKKQENDLTDAYSTIDLAMPASTRVETILSQFKALKKVPEPGMTVVFSTYQSIEVIAKAQKALASEYPEYAEFDLIICDEAHRTTGAKLAGEDESAFTRVHDNEFIKAKKRLYMTATPRMYSNETKTKAARAEATVWSMDDKDSYGDEIYRIGFGQAVEENLLSDYKVLILTLRDDDVSPAIQEMMTNAENEILLGDDMVVKLAGCVKALSKQLLGDGDTLREVDPGPMRRAIAFCPSISESKKVTDLFNKISDAYVTAGLTAGDDPIIPVLSKHIDGSMTATEREPLLNELKANKDPHMANILTNVRCLSEGVDVPALDAVMFLSGRNSQVDVVQSVGRVMRRAAGKKYGYIIIPVVIPGSVKAEVALDSNERFNVVWTVLNALRAHDDRFNAVVNKIELNKKRPDNIVVTKPYPLPPENRPTVSEPDGGDYPKPDDIIDEGIRQLPLQFSDLQNAVFARMVKQVGSRQYWEDWAKSVAKIATRQIERITQLIGISPGHTEAFAQFLKALQANINPAISHSAAIEMLAQHMITRPVFEALFEGYSFVQNNPMSKAMQGMLDLLHNEQDPEDAKLLESFFNSVRMRASGIDNAEGKQKIILELYDNFFKTAFPRMAEQLGIVYTPVEVVDFIIHSVADILQREFDRSISDENVHILDPFTGTGTFITRLLQSGVIRKEDLARKYAKEIHANEIVLLAYYIASVNIENVYHDLQGGDSYQPFEGICLTDTFQLGESREGENLFNEMFPQNSERVKNQQKAPLRIIIGNPPYSVGQKSANDNAQNQAYPKLDKRVSETYARLSTAGLNKALYDPYVKAFRWSADRLDPKHGGIICFVSNGGWLEGNSSGGFRKALHKEFSSVYVFNLRGNQRTKGEHSRREGGKVFGSGSRTPITITLLVKNPNRDHESAQIFYRDIGDYLNRDEKLKALSKLSTFANSDLKLSPIQPNEHGDWINHRNESFEGWILLASKNKYDTAAKTFFCISSPGIVTNRDAWAYNFSRTTLEENVRKMLNTLEMESLKCQSLLVNDGKRREDFPFVSDPTKISWSAGLKAVAHRFVVNPFQACNIRSALYRPYSKANIYYEKQFIERPALFNDLLPSGKEKENLILTITGPSATTSFSTLLSYNIPDIQLLQNAKCFPLYYYQEATNRQKGMFDDLDHKQYVRRDALTDFILERAREQYGKTVTKEDIFYYVYGIFHSPEYRTQFASDLKKMLPRLPFLEKVADFWSFSKAGRGLAQLHLNYELVQPYSGVAVTGLERGDFTVTKMRFIKKGVKDAIIYNSHITITGIPDKAYQYVVNGKSATEWIMERYEMSTDKKSGITNNPNDWAQETGNPRYILDLLLSIINVSVQTVDIVEGLPKVDFTAL